MGKPKVDAAAQRAANLLRLKEQRQTALLDLGNNLLGNLDVKYAPYVSDDVKALWEDQILEIVSFYEDDYEDKVEDDELHSDKKKELKSAWNEIFELIEEDYSEAAAEREEAKKENDRNKKLEALRAQGLNIWNSVNRQSAASKKARELAKQREMQRMEKEKKEKEELQKEANDDWDDSSSDDEAVKKPNVSNKNGAKQKKKNAFEDSSDDEVEVKKSQKKQIKKVNNDPFGDSDDEQAQKQQSKQQKKKRNRKKEGAKNVEQKESKSSSQS